MKKDDCFHLGYLAKSHGIKGEFKAVFDVDDPSAYTKLDAVFVEVNKKLVLFAIKSLRKDKEKGFVIGLEGVNTRNDSDALAKKQLYLPLEILPPLTGKKFYFHEIQGFQIVDTVHGKIGKVKRVIEYPGNPVIESTFGKPNILLPINDELIQEVDRDKKELRVTTPEGLIDLFSEENE